MENPPVHSAILHDLALIYIALAYGADQDLSDDEIDVITRRLEEIQADLGDGTVLHAIKQALEDYTQSDVKQRIGRAIRHLSTAVPPALRARVLRDLTEIGKADNRFLYAEARFIGELLEAWRKDGDAEPEPDVALWSLFGKVNEGWTPVHDLALIYITLAHRTDGALHRDEVEAILDKLGEWMPGANQDELHTLFNEVMQAYEEASEGRTFADAVEAVRAQIPTYQRPAILADLRYVAYADGILLVEERVLIQQLLTAWDAEGLGDVKQPFPGGLMPD